ncbi:hypothetical protein ERO13_A03G116900v2 [Gossypium hirsutum]|uniref:Uncharacterized protein n=1 Tax=Gossypium darwinii TaxID=34276 RepID=A0A5D2H4L1_GOSDA|nr:hypothetical protein ERO13_A03G116900v2 [Gossypium hirsutum]KAG4208192.1 hypothetical protein ERO13_A03G116900v2 [Gossypium hirsutum]TYH25121.1 hypothetical protein ES288_A03G143800v1 [Gossypium darwinii]
MPFLIILNLRFSLSYIQPSLCHFILSTISFDSLLLPPSLPIEEIHFADPTLIELPGYRQSPLLQNRVKGNFTNNSPCDLQRSPSILRAGICS